MAQQTERWGIIGGGILGMTLAYRLAQHGKHVTLLEGAPHLGGLASAWTLGEVVWDRHYHVTLMSDTSLRALLAELGLEQDIQWVETRTGFYTDGRLYSMSTILERFAEILAAHHVCVKLGQKVQHVATADGDGVSVTGADGQRETFDQVVLTMPAPIAARLCPALSAEEQARLHGIEYQGIICASLLLKRPLAPFYVTNITDAWVPFTAVIDMSALVDRQYFGGHSLVYLPKYVTPDDPA